MSKFRLQFLFLFTLLTIGISISLNAQSTGKITGKIIDKENKDGIPMANVLVEGTSLGAAADLDGNYVILNVPPGVYSVTSSVVGYQKVTITNVRVNVDFTTRIDFELSTGAIDLPAVVVQGERNPLIRQDLTNPTVSIDAETIQNLPVDQIADVIRLQAGVVSGNDGQLHVRGGYGNEIAYTLNGISVNDPFGNSRSIGVATNAIQEVMVSTGTFSAQYGNALSGVVNYVTKEGSDKYSFSLRGYAGDYVTNNTDLFFNLDEIDPLNRTRTEATFGGPIPGIKDAKFYLSGVYEDFKGSLYGIRLYRPTDSYLSPDNFRTSDTTRRGSSTDPYYFNPYSNTSSGLPTGDRTIVPMNRSTDWNIQGNISFRVSPLLKIKYEGVYSKGEFDGGNVGYRSFKYNPDGRGRTYQDGFIQSLDITHTLSNYVFYTLKGSFGYNTSKYYLYENTFDERYLPSLYQRAIGNTDFISGGTDNRRTNRKTTTIGVKGDVVAQIFDIHELKAGFEVRMHELQYETYALEIGKLNPDGSFGNLQNDDLLYDSSLTLIRRIPTSPNLYTNYLKKPTQIAAYVQDKIELDKSLVLNAGVRYEYFDPASQFNPEISQNLTDSLFGFISAYNIPAEAKHTISPRISVSYPITDRGVIRLSYGHFYQIGSLASLYNNDRYYVATFGSVPTFGNPNVRPQRSVQYEIGLQQQLTEDFKFDLTGFYKDVKDYIYTQTIFTSRGREYNVLSNLSYANTRGITLSFLKRRSPGELFSATLDYTFSIAEGNRTEPSTELFISEQSGKIAETYLVPLGFDRSHVINATVALTQPNDWTLGVIGNFQTGTPYSPSLPSQLSPIRYEQNSGNQPINWRVDMKFEKFFEIGSMKYSVFVQVENLFDTQNELSVYSSSGRALSNVEQELNAIQFNDIRRRIERGDVGLFGMNEIDGYYSNRPERISRPREMRLGFTLLFN